MPGKDFLILELRTFLSSTKNRKLHDIFRTQHRALVQFLQQNDLTTHTLVDDVKNTPDDFRLMRSDLTDEGFAVIEKALGRWYDGMNAGRIEPSDVSTLERALRRIRES